MPLSKARQLWVSGLRKTRDTLADTRDDVNRAWRYWRFGAGLLAAYLLLTLALGIYWSRPPALMDLSSSVDVRLDGAPARAGVALTVGVIDVAETLLNKRGGYLANDIAPPGVWLDNMPSWEYGVLQQVRLLSRALDQHFSGGADSELTLAASRFQFNHRSWIMPASESRYRAGIDKTENYLQRLQAGEASFEARHAPLDAWLAEVEQALELLVVRLNASVGDVRAPQWLENQDGDDDGMIRRTRWRDLDNVFFEARGSAWALHHFIQAVERDFADLVARQGLAPLLEELRGELADSQRSLRSPIILNGGGYGILANHSLVKAAYLNRSHRLVVAIRSHLAGAPLSLN